MRERNGTIAGEGIGAAAGGRERADAGKEHNAQYEEEKAESTSTELGY